MNLNIRNEHMKCILAILTCNKVDSTVCWIIVWCSKWMQQRLLLYDALAISHEIIEVIIWLTFTIAFLRYWHLSVSIRALYLRIALLMHFIYKYTNMSFENAVVEEKLYYNNSIWLINKSKIIFLQHLSSTPLQMSQLNCYALKLSPLPEGWNLEGRTFSITPFKGWIANINSGIGNISPGDLSTKAD